MQDKPTVSVVIPIRNEEHYIVNCLDSLLDQDYPKELLEAVLVDGMSDDNTRSIIGKYTSKYSFIKLIDNPEKTVQFALNHGIRAAKSEYIVRFDAHSEYANDYISKCIEYHLKTDADNVGGPNIVDGKTPVQKAIAAAYYSPFALGWGRNHIDGYEGYSDTVSFGSFKKETAMNLGLFDEDLTLNEDDDFNFRLVKSGGKVYINPEIRSIYFPRDSYKKLFKQYYLYGLWKVAVIKKHKRPARISHLVPVAFFCVLTAGLPISLLSLFGLLPVCLAVLYGAVITLYTTITLGASLSSKYINGLSGKLRLAYVHLLLHFSYGYGFFRGLFKFLFRKW